MAKATPKKQERRGPAAFTFRAAALAGLAYALLSGLAFAPLGIWPLAFAAPIPLVWVASRAKGRSLVTALSVAFGAAPFWAFAHRWILDVSELGYVPLVLLQAAWAGVFVWLLGMVRRGPIGVPMVLAAPLCWLTIEVLRGELLFTGYPWFLAAHPLVESPMLSAPGAIVGAYGVSFLVVALAGAFADAAGWSEAKRSTGGACATATIVAWGALSWLGASSTPPPSTGGTLEVTLIQTAVPQSNKIARTLEQRLVEWDTLERLVRSGAPRSPGLVVIPETMFPGRTLSPGATQRMRDSQLVEISDNQQLPMTHFTDRLLELQSEIGVPILVGALGYDGYEVNVSSDGTARIGWDAQYNSVFLVERGRVAPSRYDKLELTPFGEVIPYLSRFDTLEDWITRLGASGMTFGLAPGRAPVRLRPLSGQVGVPLATPICFEATKAGLCRRLAYEDGRPVVSGLVNVSNDGWFGDARGGRAQHLMCARWRCVELGLPMVRAVNTGISAHIDARGRVVDSLEPSLTGSGAALSASLPIDVPERGTPYARGGHLFAWIGAALGALLPLIVRLLAPLRRSSRTS